jgi:hypothetical protein
LSTLSCFTDKPNFRAVSTTYAEIFFSFFDPLGIWLISAKYFQTNSGFNPDTVFDIPTSFVVYETAFNFLRSQPGSGDETLLAAISDDHVLPQPSNIALF